MAYQLSKMPEHSLFPITEAEVDALVDRIGQLAGTVLNHQEWNSLFAAARQLLPRTGNRTLEPAELDVARLASSPAGRVVNALTGAFAKRETYKSNQRYGVYLWISLTNNFYKLAQYSSPLQLLTFAANILQSARDDSTETLIAAASAIEPNEPLVLRQLVSRFEIEKWKKSILEQLENLTDQGSSYLSAAEREALYDPEEYSDWYGESEKLVSLATDFCDAFRVQVPEDLDRLKSLMDDVPAPSDEDPDPEGNEFDRSAGDRTSEREYWSVERMFEDL